MTEKQNPWLKRLLIGTGTFAVMAALVIFGVRTYQAENLPKAETDLSFTRAALDFTHQFDADAMLPFLGSAAFDVDGDEQPELFLGGGVGQADTLFRFENGAFKRLNIDIPKSESDATHGAAHLDVDGDGDSDLFLARKDGVVLLRNDGGQFLQTNTTFPLAENTTPLSIALGDVNNDGIVDLYISGYLNIERIEGETIFNRPYGGYSALFISNDRGGWEDRTEAYGVFRQHNTFTAGFIDLDGDSDQDLVVAQDTGVIETWRNDDGQRFSRLENPSVNSYPMGLGFGDIDNDGDTDIWSSNVGHTLPAPLLRGDLPDGAPFNTDYYLLANNGTAGFTDVAKEKHAAKLGFGWGSVIADMDLDGRQDLLAAQNYARLPGNGILRSYPGKVLLQQADGGFADATQVAPDQGFGITPLVADFNADGAPDLVWANLAGPSRAYLSSGGTGTGVTIRLPDTIASLGAVVRVVDTEGREQTQRLVSGEGLGSDPTRSLIFGFGEAAFARASITLRDGTTRTYEAAPGGVITWTE